MPLRKISSGLRALVAAGLLSLGLASAGQAETLKIGGTGGDLGTMRLLGKAFAERNPGVTVTVLPSLGSGGGIKAVLAGAIDIGLSAPAVEGEGARCRRPSASLCEIGAGVRHAAGQSRNGRDDRAADRDIRRRPEKVARRHADPHRAAPRYRLGHHPSEGVHPEHRAGARRGRGPAGHSRRVYGAGCRRSTCILAGL